MRIPWDVRLPVNPPILPMLAKRVGALPDGDDWIFEPKWDGFRALVFRDGDEILIQSRDEKPLNRYFPDLLDPLRATLPSRCVLDGEIVIVKNDGLDFDALQLRLHPAASRVKLLAEQTPVIVRLFRFALPGRSRLSRRAIQDSAARVGIADCIGPTTNPYHTGDQRSKHRLRLVSSLRGRWAGRRHGQALFGHLRTEQTNDAQS